MWLGCSPSLPPRACTADSLQHRSVFAAGIPRLRRLSVACQTRPPVPQQVRLSCCLGISGLQRLDHLQRPQALSILTAPRMIEARLEDGPVLKCKRSSVWEAAAARSVAFSPVLFAALARFWESRGSIGLLCLQVPSRRLFPAFSLTCFCHTLALPTEKGLAKADMKRTRFRSFICKKAACAAPLISDHQASTQVACGTLRRYRGFPKGCEDAPLQTFYFPQQKGE